MFKIYDGREQFYQWDINRKLIVEDASIVEVHFCNRTDDCSLVCETYVEDGVTLVNVPNILLQNDWRIHVYAFDGEHTKHDACYDIVARTKPADYAYEETEVLTWHTINEKVDEALGNTGYYVPSIDTDGILTWEGSTELLPEVAAVNIKGAKGDKGDTGATGARGAKGEKGDKGDRGEQGIQGVPGKDGTVKFEELTAAQKAELKGDKGEQGERGFTGATGATGKDGISATHQWNGTTLTITSASGTSSQNLVGAKGAKGDKGDRGEKGETGAPFTYDMFTEEQLAALKGEKGEPGAQGIQGAKGDKGDRGAQGIQGERGLKGETGDKGEDGKDGTSVYHKWNGNTLTITSASGTSSANLQGAQGEPGRDGRDGVDGKDGLNGRDGAPGKDGADGAPGKDGVNGKNGKDGVDGYTPVRGVDYWTAEDKAEIIAEVSTGDIDLSGYVTDAELTTALNSKANTADVYTKAEVNGKLSIYATDSDVAAVDTKVTELTTTVGNKANSADVYTKSQVYNKTEVDNKIANAGGGGTVVVAAERIDIECDVYAEASGSNLATALGLRKIYDAMENGKLPDISNYYINGCSIVEGNVLVNESNKTYLKLYVIDAPNKVKCITYPIVSGSSVDFDRYKVENSSLVGAKGEDGKDGTNGNDGVSVTHSWNGTTLTVTSASGTSSADLKGEKGDTGAAGKDGSDYVLTDADKQEIAGMVEVTGGGGSGEGGSFETYALPFVYDGQSYTPDEEIKAIVEENWRYYKETGKWKTVFNTKKDGWIDYIHTDTYVDAGGNTMTTCYYDPQGCHHGIRFGFNTDGSFKEAYGYENWVTTPAPRWLWEGNYSDYTYIQLNYYVTQIKVVGYWNDDTNAISTHHITAGHGNSITEEQGTKYYVTDAFYKNTSGDTLLYWENANGNSLILRDAASHDNVCESAPNGKFTILGYYYFS